MSSDHEPTRAGCPHCGCVGCEERFERLLALEFERAEPFGRLHAVTVAAYAVQHPDRFGAEVRTGQWVVLRAFHDGGIEAVERIQAGRRRANSHRVPGGVDPLAGFATRSTPERAPRDGLTIGHVVAPDRHLDPAGHAERVAGWVASLVAGLDRG